MPSLQKTLEAISSLTMKLFGLRESLVKEMEKENAHISELRRQINAAYLRQESRQRELAVIDKRIKNSSQLIANLTDVMAYGDGYADTPAVVIEQLASYHECSRMVN